MVNLDLQGKSINTNQGNHIYYLNLKEDKMQKVRVNQQATGVANRPEHNINKNWFEGLSHHWIATFTMGKLVPFLKIPTLPNDYFKINTEVMMRFAPLYLPMMDPIYLSMDFHFVPNRIIWNSSPEDGDSWENFIMNKNPVNNPYVEYTAIDYVYGTTSELPMYMGAPTIIEDAVGNTYSINLNALPIAAYYMIYDQYYRNDQIQEPINAQDDVIGGAVNTVFTNPIAFSLSCMYKNWNRDLFTSCTPEPAAGLVQIPLVTDEYMPQVGTAIYGGPTVWRKQSDNTPAGGTLVATTGSEPLGRTILSGSGTNVYLDIQESAADITQFRFASVYQEYLERVNRTGDRITDYYPNFWDTDPYKGTLQVPQFLGTKKGRVVVSEVMSTTETTTLKVGSYAGQALALASTSDTIEYHCLEHGYIIGLISVYPDSGYFQGLERDWSKTTYLDYADPRFAQIGDEEVLNKEVQYAFQDTLIAAGWNDQTFGYRERFLDSRFKNNTVAGLMRTILNPFHLQRLLNPLDPENLTNGAVLNTSFLYCKPNITNVFQVVAGEDEIYCHIFNDIKVQRMLPKFGVPQL